MSGRPGRSGGQNKIDPAVHLLRGTFRPERHARPATAGPVWTPDTEVLERLGAAGRAFVGRLSSVYELSAVEGELLLEGGMAVDRLAELRERRERYPEHDRLPLDRMELGFQRALNGCLLALRSRMV